VWWFMVGLYAMIAGIVVFVAGPKRLITTIRTRRGQVVWAGIDLVRASRIRPSPNSNSSPKL
jgi:hypothetical protein